MQLSDQPFQFYLGQRVQKNGEALTGDPLLYDARDLTTHAVCVGMTGSGKTGLGIILLEEAALNGIPALIIDPKGDMTNLLLAFPDLSPADFRPWIDVDAGRHQGTSPDERAQEAADSWREGLAGWGIGRERIARLVRSAELTIYTPGSDAGRQVSIVQSLQAPALRWDDHAELLREMISSTVSAILALVDVESDPVTGREHILLSTIIEDAWRAGREMDLAQLIVHIQNPPFDRLGVLPLEVFYPEKERMALMLALNGLLASPRFEAWLSGEPLHVASLLRTGEGRPRLSVFYLAHLPDSERLFFVTLLLEQVRAWLRLQQGTSDLRAMLYCDELYGLMPPYPANPPTKAPLLSLLKQARAQGVGLVLSTQNPVDLDYKGLSNAGTWFIGKLQTANDRQRVLEGLGSASLEAGVSLDRQALNELIVGLEPRTFLLHNVHAPGPVLFRTRQTMSYMRGPLTRAQIRELAGQEQGAAAARQGVRPAPAEVSLRAASPPDVAKSPWEVLSSIPPVLPSGIRQYFVPARISLEWAIHSAEEEGQQGRPSKPIIYRDKQLVYHPALVGQAAVRIDNRTHNVHERLAISHVLAVPEDGSISWDEPLMEVSVDELDERPLQGARFASLPPVLSDARRLAALQKDFADNIYQETVLTLGYHPLLKLVARPGESESRFKRRCYQAIEDKRDAETAKIEKRYRDKIDRLEARIRREERELEQDQSEYEARKREEMLSAGESVLNMLTGRRHSRMLSTASRKRRLTQQSRADVDESVEAIDDLEEQIQALQEELEREKAGVHDRWAEAADVLETIQLRPHKADILVEAWGVIWLPHWEIVFDEGGVERQLRLAAFEPDAAPD
jgi:hypothetical protein